MSYTELQTAAIRLVHVTRPSDRDLDYLQREFHLDTSEVEAVLGVSSTSRIVVQPRHRRLSVVWPVATRRGLAVTEIHCLVGSDWLAIIDHGNFPAAVEVMTELQTLPPERLWQDGPMMVLYEILRRAIRDLGTIESLPNSAQAAAMTSARAGAAEIVKQFVTTSPDLDASTVSGWRWLAFSLGHAHPATVRVPVATSPRLPLTARSYAAASAAVAIATLLVISKTL